MSGIAPRWAGIFGTGRAGTTWLGAIVSSHPNVAYRFESFHRGQIPGNERLRKVVERVREERIAKADVPEIYDVLLEANPEWEKPPFLRKRYASRSSAGRALLWPLARKNAIARALFRFLYTPLDRPYIVSKEVALEYAFGALASHTRIPLVYLIRHPCATIHSQMKGQRQGVLGVGRRNVIRDYLKDHAPALFDVYGGRIDSLGPHQHEALLWRANVETCYRAIGEDSNVRTVFYENLCRRPAQTAAEVVSFFGLPMEDQILGFIEASTRPSTMTRFRFGEVGIDPFFSVFRDPENSLHRWETELEPAQQREILEITRGSDVFSHGARAAAWSE